MQAKRERLLHVHYSLGDQWQAMNRLLQWDPDLEHLYSLSSEQFSSLLSLTPTRAAQFYNFLHSVSPSTILQQLQQEQIFYMTVWDKEYPQLLREISDPPFILYGKGDASILQPERRLAIVGTRQPSSYGISSIQRLIPGLVADQWTIVSGMAYGIDIAAHVCAVEQKSPTIAVLGGGFRYIYPQDNYTVLQKHSHLVLYITEYPPHFRAQKWYFPKRNRIISGLSQGIVVAEAKARSGSLITVDCALEQNREVFAIPGPITLHTSAGTNWLIQQGAKLVQEAADITVEFQKY